MKKAIVFILILTMTICCFVACDYEESNDKSKQITKEQALKIAEQHWGLSTGDIDSGNGFEYRISIVATPTDTAPYYVAHLSWLVNYLPDSNEQHYSLVERIFIDAVSGECTIG